MTPADYAKEAREREAAEAKAKQPTPELQLTNDEQFCKTVIQGYLAEGSHAQQAAIKKVYDTEIAKGGRQVYEAVKAEGEFYRRRPTISTSSDSGNAESESRTKHYNQPGAASQSGAAVFLYTSSRRIRRHQPPKFPPLRPIRALSRRKFLGFLVSCQFFVD
jgi:hypothetical protein